jgi:hypothetical protein
MTSPDFFHTKHCMYHGTKESQYIEATAYSNLHTKNNYSWVKVWRLVASRNTLLCIAVGCFVFHVYTNEAYIPVQCRGMFSNLSTKYSAPIPLNSKFLFHVFTATSYDTRTLHSIAPLKVIHMPEGGYAPNQSIILPCGDDRACAYHMWWMRFPTKRVPGWMSQLGQGIGWPKLYRECTDKNEIDTSCWHPDEHESSIIHKKYSPPPSM